MATTEEIRLVVSSEVDKALRDLGLLEQKTKKTSSAFSAFGKLLSVGLVAVGFKKMVDATIEVQKVQAQLNAVLKSTSHAAGLTANEINKMADAMSDLTAIDKEEIIGAQNILLTFTKIGKETFPVATKAVLDLSVAWGQDFKSSAIQVGKALQDPLRGISALNRAGVQFSESQKAQIENFMKMNNLAGAQGVILDELNRQIGGSAEAYAGTLGGTMQKISNAFEDMFETAGEELTPALIELGDAFVRASKDGGILFTAMQGIVKVVNFIITSLNKAKITVDSFSLNKKFNEAASSGAYFEKQLEKINLWFENKYGKIAKQLGKTPYEVALANRALDADTKKMTDTYQEFNKKAANAYAMANDASGAQTDIMNKYNIELDKTKNKINEQIALREKQKKIEEDAIKNKKNTPEDVAPKRKEEETKRSDYTSYIKENIDFEIEQENFKYQQLLSQADQFNIDKEALAEQHTQNLLSLKEKQLNQETALELKTRQLFAGTLGINTKAYSDYASFMMANLDKNNKTQFAIWKAFSIVQAIGDTYGAANSAYRAMAGIPVVGPALGAAAAASAIALGLKRVNEIRKLKPEKKAAMGAFVPGSYGGTSLTVGENRRSEVVLPVDNPESIAKIKSALGNFGGITVNITGNFFANENWPQDVVKKIDRELYKLKQTKGSVAFS